MRPINLRDSSSVEVNQQIDQPNTTPATKKKKKKAKLSIQIPRHDEIGNVQQMQQAENLSSKTSITASKKKKKRISIEIDTPVSSTSQAEMVIKPFKANGGGLAIQKTRSFQNTPS